jgi:prepilin-type N-terminal cleavage/methylation domain-containing protein
MPKLPKLNSKGFTLIELIVVIGMLTILFAIVLVAVNPGRQFASSRNTARQNDVNAILSAIHQYAADNNGSLPTAISSLTACAAPCATATAISNTGANICANLMPNYLPALPQDPGSNNGAQITSCTTYTTGYTVSRDSSNRVTVYAPSAENGATISVQR